MQSQQKKILIIDDSLANLQVIGKLLEKDNYQITFAESGKIALDLLKEGGIPDVILLDIMMPGMDGFTFKRKINADNELSKIPVIVISALKEQENKSIAFELGCVDYIVKPVYKTEVLNRINVQLKIIEQSKELSRINKELAQSNIDKDKIFSIISHDLRSSIGNIKNVFKFIIDGLIDPEVDKDLLIDAEITSRNTFNLLENLLYWAKSQQGQIINRPELVNVSRLVSSVVEMERGSMISKNIEFIESIDSNLFIWSDKVLFTIVIRNLLVNAIKFTNDGGRISIVSKKEHQFAKISVIDNGVGMDSESLEKLKLEESFTTKGTRNEKGTGLGLFLVKEFIVKCNGKFEVKSKLGVGSEFIVMLPIDKD